MNFMASLRWEAGPWLRYPKKPLAHSPASAPTATMGTAAIADVVAAINRTSTVPAILSMIMPKLLSLHLLFLNSDFETGAVRGARNSAVNE